ncbi:MAG: DUF2628 domain-containing protein [Alphaproteobacteria bacterium]|nr:DUF2628 domain-containing protein [Alphaproteobacteria bacterium]
MMFGGMKIYTVHIKTDASRSGEKPIFIREGFSFGAFFFTVFWALYHRLWLPAAGIMFSLWLIVQLGTHHFISSPSVGVLQLMIQVLVGYLANDWRRRALAKRGYITSDVTAADSLLRAEQRYFERYLQTVST